MIKRMTLTTAAMTLGFMAGTAGANLVETFDGAGYIVGNDVPTPPYTLSGPEQELPIVAAFGFNGTQGTTKALDAAWGAAARPTGVTGAARGFTYSWMLYEDAVDDGLTRLGGGLNTLLPILANNYGDVRFNYEDDNNTMALLFSNGGPSASIPIADDTWYEFLLTGTPAPGGWDVTVEHRIDAAGPYTTDIPTTFWAQPTFVPAFVSVEMISLEGNSAQDNIIVQDIPGPPRPPSLIGMIGFADTTGFMFQSMTGVTYDLQFTLSTNPPTWTPTGVTKEGNGGSLTLLDPTGFNTGKTYRVIGK
jgi:hypothetical protein